MLFRADCSSIFLKSLISSLDGFHTSQSRFAFQFISFLLRPNVSTTHSVCSLFMIHLSISVQLNFNAKQSKASREMKESQYLLMMHIVNCIGIKWHNKWDNEKNTRENDTEKGKKGIFLCASMFYWASSVKGSLWVSSIEWCAIMQWRPHNKARREKKNSYNSSFYWTTWDVGE